MPDRSVGKVGVIWKQSSVSIGPMRYCHFSVAATAAEHGGVATFFLQNR